MIVAGTGHRPNECISENDVRIKSQVKLRYNNKIKIYINGLADGFDLWSADEAIGLGLEVWSAMPYEGHQSRTKFPDLYQKVLEASSKVVILEDAYHGPWVMHNRNHWMVDNADVVMAYWNMDKQSGGTFQCVKYARKKEKKVANIFYDPPF